MSTFSKRQYSLTYICHFITHVIHLGFASLVCISAMHSLFFGVMLVSTSRLGWDLVDWVRSQWDYLQGIVLNFWHVEMLLSPYAEKKNKKSSLKLSHCPMCDDHFRPRSKISQFFHAACLSSGTAQNQAVYSRLETRGFEAYWVFPAVWLQSYQRNQCEWAVMAQQFGKRCVCSGSQNGNMPQRQTH